MCRTPNALPKSAPAKTHGTAFRCSTRADWGCDVEPCVMRWCAREGGVQRKTKYLWGDLRNPLKHCDNLCETPPPRARGPHNILYAWVYITDTSAAERLSGSWQAPTQEGRLLQQLHPYLQKEGGDGWETKGWRGGGDRFVGGCWPYRCDSALTMWQCFVQPCKSASTG